MHDPAYVAAVRRAAEGGGGWVRSRHADHAALVRRRDARRRRHAGRARRGDAAGRDVGVLPGAAAGAPRHSRPGDGLCLFNHVAVAAAYARRTYGPSAWRSSTTTCISQRHAGRVLRRSRRALHLDARVPVLPGYGCGASDRGGAGRGCNVNIPMRTAPATRRTGAFEDVAMPALHRYRPQLVLVSAGYDAHFADEIAGQQLSVDGFGALVAMVKDAAAGAVRRASAARAGGRLSPRRAAVVRAADDRSAARRPPGARPAGAVASRTPAGFDAMLAEVKTLHAL